MYLFVVIKKINPNIITVQGGTNFPHESELQLDFLLSRPNTDIFVELEAEVVFSEDWHEERGTVEDYSYIHD